MGRKTLNQTQYNHVSCTIPAPCSFGQVITTICEQAQAPIPIELLSLQLRIPVLSRGKTVFGDAWDEIDKIAFNYPHMEWWISEHGLKVDSVVPTPALTEFYEIAGRLMSEMRQKHGGRLSRDQYLEITAQLENFNPLDLLPKAKRTDLAQWNQKYGKDAIHTLSQALSAKGPSGLHRQTMKVLYRAHDKFRRQQSHWLNRSS